MLAKLLKRKDSRQAMDLHPINKGQDEGQKQQEPKLQYRYQRPDLLGKVSVSVTRWFFN